MKKLYKYPTGAEIPKGAIYLGTVTQTWEDNGNTYFKNEATQEEIKNGTAMNREKGHIKRWERCWHVWHYFLIELD